MKTTLALCLIAAVAGPSAADDLFQRPEGCVLVATAQFSNCEMANSFVCGTGDGAFFRIEGFTAVGRDTVIHEALDRALIDSVDAEGNRMSFKTSVATHPREVIRTGAGRLAAEAMFTFEGQELPITYTLDMTHDGAEVEVLGHSFLRIDAVTELVFPGMGTIPGAITFGYLPEIDLLVRLDSTQEIPGNNGVKTLESLSLRGEDGAGIEVPQFGCNQQGGLILPGTMVPA